ncbi:hypothetical protein PM082_000434 [Marasmius tenuissimus]|nr:hypothetical protein PM082_000434 [Marasmius tenuissimus]
MTRRSSDSRSSLTPFQHWLGLWYPHTIPCFYIEELTIAAHRANSLSTLTSSPLFSRSFVCVNASCHLYLHLELQRSPREEVFLN